jgi:hypothetical protein
VLLVEELKFYGYKNITVIADASLRHKVKDLQVLGQLQQLCEYRQAPAKTEADEFLLAEAEKEKCRIVSNDKFAKWKATNPQWAKNTLKKIDDIRIKFTIGKNGSVILSGLEEREEKAITG